MEARKKLKAMLETGERIVAPGAYDPMTAVVVESLGFPAIYCGGEMTGHLLSVTEPLLTLTEQVEVARSMVKRTNLPVIVDAHTGFGDPVHVQRCVREFEAAGISAVHIEDQVYPKRLFYTQNRLFVIPEDEFYDKIKAALDARRDENFIIIGRTDAWRAVNGSPEEGIKRAVKLAELGVDVVFPLHSSEPEAMEAFPKAVQGTPLMAQLGRLMGHKSYFEFLDSRELFKMGYSLQIFPQVYQLAIAPVIQIYRTLKEKGVLEFDLNLNEEKFVQARDYLDRIEGLQNMLSMESSTVDRQ